VPSQTPGATVLSAIMPVNSTDIGAAPYF
jgi:hypothetical protein